MSEQQEWVNHPKHYNQHPSGVECIDIVRWMTFNVGSAMKYLWRSGLKPGANAIEDLREARFYIDDEIYRLTTLSKPANSEPFRVEEGGA